MKHIILGLAFVLAGCSSPDTATRALESAGYSQIKILGYQFFGCSKDDTFHTGFTAVGPTGTPVTGVVCGGLLKGSTIRTN
jgi:hypothetical protein